jgi:hypothetical protein
MARKGRKAPKRHTAKKGHKVLKRSKPIEPVGTATQGFVGDPPPPPPPPPPSKQSQRREPC